MSDEYSKKKHSKRIQQTENQIHKQQKIALQHGLTRKEVEREPHRFAKHHAMDCGNPECFLCANPRHLHKHGETKQEKSFKQTETWND